MNHPREPYDRLFDRFNACFAAVAEEEGFTFELRAGPNLGRTLRLKDDPLKRGIFLELKRHWSRSDLSDPAVVVSYGAWYHPTSEHFPLYVLIKIFYDGTLNGLNEASLRPMLKSAAAEIRPISPEQIMRDGRVFKDWSGDASEVSSYFDES